MLRISATAAAAQDAWDLALMWRLRAETIAADGGEDAQAFLRWAQRFEQICAERGRISGGRTLDVLAGAAGALKLPPFLLLAGFDEFTPQQEALIEACGRSGCEVKRIVNKAVGPESVGARSVPRCRIGTDSRRYVGARASRKRHPGDRGGSSRPGTRRREVDRIFRLMLQPGAILPGAGVSAVLNFSAGEPLHEFPVMADRSIPRHHRGSSGAAVVNSARNRSDKVKIYHRREMIQQVRSAAASHA